MSSKPVSADEFRKTAVILKDFGNLHGAARYFSKAEDHLKAARLFEHTKDFEKAGDEYYQSGKFEKALEMYIKTGRKDKRVAELYEWQEDYRRAAEIWKILGYTRNWKRCMNKFREPTLFDLEK